MFCAECGRSNPDDARFCSKCGAMLRRPGMSVTPPLYVSEAEFPEYAGFTVRAGAWLIDTVVVTVFSLFGLAVSPFLWWWLWWGLYLLPGAYYVLLTGLRGQTIGKMAVQIRIVNEEGRPPGIGYAFLREIIGKLVSGLFFMLGYLWVIWDSEKQAWHDKIARTHVVRTR